MSSQAKTQIVIVGGSSGGPLARKLSTTLDPNRHALTLIDARPCYVHLIASLRVLVTDEGSLEKTALVPYDKLFEGGKVGVFKQGRVERVLDGVLELENGERIKYDILVLATGSKWDPILSFPDSKEDLAAFIEDWRRKFATAKSVAIIGGGSVGIELAAEIKHYHPKTAVTLVHSGNTLLNEIYPDKFRNVITAKVRTHGIKLVLDDRLDAPPAGQTTATTKKGTRVDADLYIAARGNRPNTDILKYLDGGNVLTPSGTVKVLPTLQVERSNGKNIIFALGDIIEWPEAKMLAKAAAHADVVAQNVLDVANGGTPTKKYGGFMEGLFVTLGPNAGSGYIPKLWGLTFGDRVVPMIKSKGLFISKSRQAYGYAA